MIQTRIARTLLSAACLVALAPSVDAHAEGKTPLSAQVGQLFDQAQAAYAKGDKQGAYEAYKAAWALQKSYDIAGNLGNVELKLGKNRDAAEHLSFALDNFPPTGEPDQQKAVAKKLAEALQEVGRVRVRVLAGDASVEGASIRVNGAPVGTTPAGSTLFVNPGQTVVEASLAGYEDARAQIQVSKGSEQQVSLQLHRRGPSLAIIVTGSVLTAGSIAAAVGLTVAANAKGSSANAELATLQKTGVPCPSASIGSGCAGLRSTLGQASTLHNAALGTYVGAGMLGVATVAYVLVSTGRAPKKETTGVRVIPVAGSAGGGVLIRGAF